MCNRDGLCYNCAATLLSYVIVGNMIFGAWWFVGGPGLNANKVDVMKQLKTTETGTLSSNHIDTRFSNTINGDNVPAAAQKGKHNTNPDRALKYNTNHKTSITKAISANNIKTLNETMRRLESEVKHIFDTQSVRISKDLIIFAVIIGAMIVTGMVFHCVIQRLCCNQNLFRSLNGSHVDLEGNSKTFIVNE